MKKSQIQIAIDRIQSEIDELVKVRDRLYAVRDEKPKRERKPKTTAAPLKAAG